MADKLPHVRWVNQRDYTGCAVACIAIVTGTTYSEAKRASRFVTGRQPRGELHLTFPQIASTIRRLGFRCRYGTDFMEEKQRTILMFDWPAPYGPGTHCVVWDPSFGGRFVDPGYRNLFSPSWSDSDPRKGDFYLDCWRECGQESLMITGRQ